MLRVHQDCLEFEKGEEVNQGEVPILVAVLVARVLTVDVLDFPILVVNLDLKAVDVLNFLLFCLRLESKSSRGAE